MTVRNSNNINSSGSTKQINKRISDDVIGGAFAGIVARIITAPFDVIKIRFQLQTNNSKKYHSMRHAFKTVIKEEGVLSLWKGNLSATYLWISYAIVQFSVYGFLKKIAETVPDPFSSPIAPCSNHNNAPYSPSVPDCSQVSIDLDNIVQKEQKHKKVYQSKLWRGFMLFLAGAGAGITSTVTTYPFDIMRTQFAMQGQEKYYRTMNSYIIDTWKDRGLAGFYAGVGPAVVGVTPYMGLSFAFYETLKLLLDPPLRALASKNQALNSKDNNDSNLSGAAIVLKNGLCGGLSGGMAKFSVYPLDTIKKRLQGQVVKNTLSPHVPQFHYTGILNCAATIYRHEGVQGFYRGLVPTTVKAVVATAITFAAYESAKDFLVHQREKDDY